MSDPINRFGKILTLLTLLLPGEIRAADPAPAGAKPAAPPLVVYKAAKGSAPAARVTGGSRGSGDLAITLDVLAPDDTGLTTQEQPSLFWYQSKPAQARFELTLIEPGTTKPVLQVKVDRAASAGIQRLRLSDHGVKLTPGVEYQWVVALVTDPNNRSSDLVASGFIKRMEPTAELKAKVAGAAPDNLPAIYAEAGIWHDALSSLSDLIEAQPDNAALRAERADLLRQVGLKAAAAAEATPAKS